ncbi:hypothetical protein Chor_009303 [Crotalus horridus]
MTNVKQAPNKKINEAEPKGVMELLRRGWEDFDPRLYKRLKLVEVEGISLLDSTAANLELLRNFKAQPDDLLICTYPKADDARTRELGSVCRELPYRKKSLKLPDPILKKVFEYTKFETMKTNSMANYRTLPAFVMNQVLSPFIRKDGFPPIGIVGDWKEHLTVAQNEKIEEICSRLLANSGLVFRTEL